MQAYDWSQFSLRIPIKGSKQLLYELWTNQEGLESWFLRKAEFHRPGVGPIPPGVTIQVGDTYEWLWYGYGDDTAERGSILAANGHDQLKFSFGKAGIVTVTIREGEETMVELTQSEIPVDEKGKEYYHIGCTKGWTFYLANLKSIVEGGIDLRNRNIALQEVVNS